MAQAAPALDAIHFAALDEAGLEFLANVEAVLSPAHALLDAPFGGRLIVDVTGARVEGPRLRASLSWRLTGAFIPALLQTTA